LSIIDLIVGATDCVKTVIAMKIVGVDDPVHPRADSRLCEECHPERSEGSQMA